ncbi:hypothetical protein VNO78_31125 [Psophocarpus tetragonolobus]|uniref:Transcription initiation factor IIA subunit 2 n=1 Tax=Psophocarpus tetragonolobus TaxID=3891 RepID=A0AAN9X748_PSOTE
MIPMAFQLEVIEVAVRKPHPCGVIHTSVFSPIPSKDELISTFLDIPNYCSSRRRRRKKTEPLSTLQRRHPIHRVSQAAMATFELYRRSTIGMCLTETLDEMVQNGTLSPELAIQVLVQFDKSMTEALETQVKSKVSIKGHLHTYRFCDNVWTFILQDALFKNEDSQEPVGRVKIVACDSKLLTQ